MYSLSLVTKAKGAIRLKDWSCHDRESKIACQLFGIIEKRLNFKSAMMVPSLHYQRISKRFKFKPKGEGRLNLQIWTSSIGVAIPEFEKREKASERRQHKTFEQEAQVNWDKWQIDERVAAVPLW